MAFPVVEGEATTVMDSANLNIVLNLPSGITSGNLLLAVFSTDGGRTLTTEENGWTVIGEWANSTNVKLWVAYRVAGASEPASQNIIDISGSETAAGIVYEISGAEDPSTQLPEFATVATGTSTAPNAGTCVPTGGSKDYIYMVFQGNDRNRTTDAFPTGYGNTQNPVGSGANSCGLGIGRKEFAGASSLDPDAFTISASDQWIAQTMAIHPAAGAAATHPGWQSSRGGWW